MKPNHPPGPPMTIGNMRVQGVRRLIAFCLNDSCRHQAVKEAPGSLDDWQSRPAMPKGD